MELGWIKSCVFGFLSGLLDIFPVSAEAHRVLLLKFFGLKAASDIMNLLIHTAVFAAYFHEQGGIVLVILFIPYTIEYDVIIGVVD